VRITGEPNICPVRTTRLLVSVIAPVVAAALGVAACGSSGGDAGSLSKSQFAAKSNDLCSKADAERAQLLQQLQPTPSGSTDSQNLQRAAGIDRRLLRDVDALVPPQAEQDSVDRLLDAWRQRADVEDEYAVAVELMQDPQTLAGFTANLAQIDATAAPIANQLGMSQCARGAS
jgi:hypothetical protein